MPRRRRAPYRGSCTRVLHRASGQSPLDSKGSDLRHGVAIATPWRAEPRQVAATAARPTEGAGVV